MQQASSVLHRSVPLNKVEFSPDGKRFAGLTIVGITIYDSATLEKARAAACCCIYNLCCRSD